MKTELTSPRKARLVVSMAVFAGLCLALVGVSARSTKKPLPRQETPAIQIRNYTKAFEVVDTQTVGEMYIVMLKNVSQKAISAYTRSLGPSNHPTDARHTDGTVSGQVISPGAIHREEIPLIAFTHSAETTSSHQAILNFVAVLFDDHSGDGLPEAVQVLKDWGLGERAQLKRIKRLLNDTAMAQDADMPAKLNDLRASISALSETPKDGESDAVGMGLLSAKRHALVMLDHFTTEHGGLEGLSGPTRAEHAKKVLSSLIEQVDVWLSRY